MFTLLSQQAVFEYIGWNLIDKKKNINKINKK